MDLRSSTTSQSLLKVGKGRARRVSVSCHLADGTF